MKISDIKPRNLTLGQVFDDFARDTEDLDFSVEDLCSYITNDVTNYYWLNIESIWGRMGFTWDTVDELGHFSPSDVDYTIIPRIPDPHRIQSFANTFNECKNKVVLLDSGWSNLKYPYTNYNTYTTKLKEYHIESAPSFLNTLSSDYGFATNVPTDVSYDTTFQLFRDCQNDNGTCYRRLNWFRIDDNNKYLNINNFQSTFTTYYIVYDSNEPFDWKFILKNKDEGITNNSEDLKVLINEGVTSIRSMVTPTSCKHYIINSIFKGTTSNVVEYNIPIVYSGEEWNFTSYEEFLKELDDKANRIDINNKENFRPSKLYDRSYDCGKLKDIYPNRGYVTYTGPSDFSNYVGLYNYQLLAEDDIKDNTINITEDFTKEQIFNYCTFININCPIDINIQSTNVVSLCNYYRYNTFYFDKDKVLSQLVDTSTNNAQYLNCFNIYAKEYSQLILHTYYSMLRVPDPFYYGFIGITLMNDVIYQSIEVQDPSLILNNFKQLRCISCSLELMSNVKMGVFLDDDSQYESINSPRIKLIYDEQRSKGVDFIVNPFDGISDDLDLTIDTVEEELTADQISQYGAIQINFFGNGNGNILQKIKGNIIVKDITIYFTTGSGKKLQGYVDNYNIKYFSFSGTLTFVDSTSSAHLAYINAMLNNLYSTTSGDNGEIVLYRDTYQLIDQQLIQKAINLGYTVTERIN